MIGRVVRLQSGRALIGVFAAVFLLNMGYGMVLPIIPLYARGYGASTSLIGLMLSAVAVGRLTLQLPAGYLVDRLGDRPVAAAGLVLYAPALLGMAALPHPAVFVPLRLIEGCAEGIALPALYAIVSSRSEPDRVGTSFGLFTSSATAGLALAPAIGGLFVAHIGPRPLFVVVAAGAVLSALVVLASVGPPRLDAEARSRRPSGLGALRALTGPLVVQLLPALSASLVSRVAFAAVLVVVPLYTSDYLHLRSDALGLLFTLNFAVFSFGQPLAGWVSDRTGGHRDLVPAVLVMGAAFGLLGFTSWFAVFAALLVVEAFAACWVVVASRRLAARAAAAVGHGKAFAVLGVGGDVGSLAGPVLATSLYDAGTRLPFLLVAAMSGLALVSTVRFGRPHREDAP